MTDAPQRALDPDLSALTEDRLPPGGHLVRAAQEGGYGWVAIRAWAGADDTVIVHPEPDLCVGDQVVPISQLKLHETRGARVAGGRVETLTEVARAAADAGLGLIVRIRDSRTCGPAGAVLAKGATRPSELRSRLLVVTPDSRVGKRLRLDAGQLPSAVEFTGTEPIPARWVRRRLPHVARGAADADHLIAPWDLFPERHIRERLAPTLALRGADLWLTGVATSETARLADWPVRGLLLRAPVAV